MSIQQTFKEQFKQYWNNHKSAYVSMGLMLTVSAIIAVLTLWIVSGIERTEVKDGLQRTEVKVMLNDNDTILPVIVNDVKEIIERLDAQQKDSIAVQVRKVQR